MRSGRRRSIDLFIIHDRHKTVAVIPAQAGIQMIQKAPTKRGNTSNTALSATRRLFNKLDSRLRGNDDVVDFATIAPVLNVVFIYVRINRRATNGWWPATWCSPRRARMRSE
jgi:hypothetical protein